MRALTLGALLFGAASSGCAVISAADRPKSAAVMHSAPPDAREDVSPRLDRGQAWVPGYYEPAFGAWTWHPGRAVEKKPGYRVVEAQYMEHNGEFRVRLPHWEPERVATRQ
jgi:hypothetical protein